MQTILLALALLNLAPKQEAKFLAFQVFTGSPDPAQAIGDSGLQPLGHLPDKASLIPYIRDLKSRIGTVGTHGRHLAVIFGPLAFDQSDAEITNFIRNAFEIATTEKIAVGFHIEDSMFWARRKDLLNDPTNIEWMDWQGTPSTGRRIDWSSQPKELPPQMCFNSKRIEIEVRHRSLLIGRCIFSERNKWKKLGKPDLFAGIIAGWETQIGQDFKTNRYLGFHALSNLGYSSASSTLVLDDAREKVVQTFIDLWSKGLYDGGIPASQIYSQTTFLSRRVFDSSPPGVSYSQFNHFAPPETSFGAYHRPGFSIYPQPGLFDQIYGEVAKRGGGTWASSEGTNLQLGSQPGQSGMNMETYLAKMFNHGASLVNIFSWGVGGVANKNMDFRQVTEGPEAIAAYQKFLSGAELTESTVTTTSYLERLPAKIRKIQRELPDWIKKTGRQQEAQALLQQLDSAVKGKHFDEAEKVADKLLTLIGG